MSVCDIAHTTVPGPLTSMADDPLVRLDGLHVHPVLLLPDTKHPPASALLPLLRGRVLLDGLHAFLQQLRGFGFGQVIWKAWVDGQFEKCTHSLRWQNHIWSDSFIHWSPTPRFIWQGFKLLHFNQVAVHCVLVFLLISCHALCPNHENNEYSLRIHPSVVLLCNWWQSISVNNYDKMGDRRERCMSAGSLEAAGWNWVQKWRWLLSDMQKAESKTRTKQNDKKRSCCTWQYLCETTLTWHFHSDCVLIQRVIPSKCPYLIFWRVFRRSHPHLPSQ